MNSFKRVVIVGLTVIGLGGAAFAASESQVQGAGSLGTSAGMYKHDGAKYKERMEKRHAELREKLKLTQNQEAAWKTFTTAMMPAAHGPRPNHGDWANLSAPQRMEKMMEKSKQRQEMMAARLVEVKNFYAQLTPNQQKVFNDNFAKPHGHRHHHGRS